MRHQNSEHAAVEDLIKQQPKGSILFPGDYFSIGSPESILMAFSRMAKNKVLIRLGKGIYLKPENTQRLGPEFPSLETIARKIAEKEKVLIRPTGSAALNKLGLSTQVPTKVVFLTDGNPRTIKVGKGTINFKSTTPKKLAAKSDTVFLAIQALMELGAKGLNEKTIETLYGVLKNESPAIIREDARLAPNHVARTLYGIADKIEKNG